VSTFDSIQRVFHERGRLAICSALVGAPRGLSFRQLQESCELTDGNLNRHLHALGEVGIVTAERKTGAGRPQTLVRITAAGRERFLNYIDALEAVVRDVRSAARAGAVPKPV